MGRLAVALDSREKAHGEPEPGRTEAEREQGESRMAGKIVQEEQSEARRDRRQGREDERDASSFGRANGPMFAVGQIDEIGEIGIP